MTISVPMMSDADNILDKDWFLYLIQATGLTRDRKMTLEHLFDLGWDINVLNSANNGYNAFATRNASSGYMQVFAESFNGPGDLSYFLGDGKFDGDEVKIDADGNSSFFRAQASGTKYGRIGMNDDGSSFMEIASSQNTGGGIPIKASVYLNDFSSAAHTITLLGANGVSTFSDVESSTVGFNNGTYFESGGNGILQVHANSFQLYDCDIVAKGLSGDLLTVMEQDPITGRVTLRADTLDILEGFTLTGEMTFQGYANHYQPIRMMNGAPILTHNGTDFVAFASPNSSHNYYMDIVTWNTNTQGTGWFGGNVDIDSVIRVKHGLTYRNFATADTIDGHFNIVTGTISAEDIITAKEDVHFENDLLGFKDSDQSWHSFATLDRSTGIFDVYVNDITAIGEGDFYGTMGFRSFLKCRNAANDGWEDFASRDNSTGFMDVTMRQGNVRDRLRVLNQDSNGYNDFAVRQSSGVMFTYQGRGYYGTNSGNYLVGANSGDPARIYAPNAVVNYGASRSDSEQNPTLSNMDAHYSNSYNTGSSDCTIYLPSNPVDLQIHTIARFENGADHYYLSGNGKVIRYEGADNTSVDLKAEGIHVFRVQYSSAAGRWWALPNSNW